MSIKLAPAVFKYDLSFLYLLLVLMLLFRRPPVRIDAVEHVTGVMVDGAQCSHDAEALLLCLVDTRCTRIECIVHQILARLMPQQTFAQIIQHTFLARSADHG